MGAREGLGRHGVQVALGEDRTEDLLRGDEAERLYTAPRLIPAWWAIWRIPVTLLLTPAEGFSMIYL
jgi:hypothetical protein